ncbi:hypothetical protein [Virgibacillus salinus]|uniref:Uncharacterized protein n=1 Tax=Virgibacillus salinus TaxID=553311 RepID=A0A1H0ZBW1_9BACI|nr:hypothetical protein [Virgibacillus salinus]SDQ24894.1 hypothetical protein SAMN05216231_1138 [Virgibacillus salinus]
MVEQERYKNMLKRMIDETENLKFQSSEELIQALIQELTNGKTNTNKVSN